MKQLLQALPSDASSERTSRRAPSYACAAVPAHVSPTAPGAAMPLTTKGAKGRFATLHGANRLMVIPTNAHRRPPETPT